MGRGADEVPNFGFDDHAGSPWRGRALILTYTFQKEIVYIYFSRSDGIGASNGDTQWVLRLKIQASMTPNVRSWVRLTSGLLTKLAPARLV